MASHAPVIGAPDAVLVRVVALGLAQAGGARGAAAVRAALGGLDLALGAQRAQRVERAVAVEEDRAPVRDDRDVGAAADVEDAPAGARAEAERVLPVDRREVDDVDELAQAGEGAEILPCALKLQRTRPERASSA